MKKTDGKFQTHIPEPRWQQVVSIVIAIIIGLGWLWYLIGWAFFGWTFFSFWR